jgi:hypothetical protein
VASGHLHRQDSHLLERQLASLHERAGFEPPRPVDFAAVIMVSIVQPMKTRFAFEQTSNLSHGHAFR